MSTSITQSCIWESCTKQNIDYPCNLLHAQETYNTIMSMHAFGYINRCSYSTTLLKYSCYIIFLVETRIYIVEFLVEYICKNSEYLNVHGVMIDLFLSFSPGNIYYLINFV